MNNNNMENIYHAISAVYTERELVEKLALYINDMSFSRGECIQILKDIFGEEYVLNYERISDFIMGLDAPKPVELF